MLTDISDRLPVFLLFTNSQQKKPTYSMKHRRLTSKSVESFKRSLAETSWNHDFGHQDTETAYQTFMNIFSSLFNKCFPLVQSRSISKPWFKPALRKSSIIKNKLYKKTLISPTPLNIAYYKKYIYKNKFSKVLKDAKKKIFF